MRRLAFILLILAGSALSVEGQQLPQSSFFTFDHMTINPGYAGSQEGVCVNLMARNQWLGFEGAPTTQKFDAHMPFKLFGAKHGVGLALYNDAAGRMNDINATISYAFLQSIGSGTLGIGAGFGFINQTFGEGDWTPIDAGDPMIPSGSGDTKLAFTANLGVYYQTPNVFLGLSAMNINAGKLQIKGSEGNSAYARLVRQFTVTGGYNFQLSNPLFELQPSVMFTSIISSTQLNANMILRYRKKVWAGAGYRSNDAATILLGAEPVEGLNFGLAYDITTSKIAKFDDGSVEFFVRYVFKLGIEREFSNYKSIRYL